MEDVRCAEYCRRPSGPEDYSADFQVAFPYRGFFVWHVAGEGVVSDPNQVLYVRAGESFRVSRPRTGGYAEVIITPALSALQSIAAVTGSDLERHPLFAARCCRITPRLQRRCAQFIQCASDDARDPFAAEEELVALLREALDFEPRPLASAATRQLIARAKEFLEAEFTSPIRLANVAIAAGGSSAYLTHVFRRFEGVSLHQYVMQLRLARALVDLPHAHDLTLLALELGFSSHSHFTLAFRRVFGETPSEYRNKTGRRRGGPPPARTSA